MNVLKIWDKINDILGKSILHPQYFVFAAENASVKIILPLLRGKVLDIGCGRQLLKEEVEKRGNEYKSLDHPEIYKRQRSNIKPAILADISNIPLKNNSIDSILLLMVLAHLPHPNSAIKEAVRILKKGGRVFITSVENYPAHDLPDDYFRYRLSGIVSLCKEAGLKIDKTFSWGNVWQVNTINFNLFLLQTSKTYWDKRRNVIGCLILLALFYPLMFFSNILAFLLSPFDPVKGSRLINFVIARK